MRWVKNCCRLTKWWLSQVLAEHMGCWGTKDDPLILEELLWADWWAGLGSWQLWRPEAWWLSCGAPQSTERRGACIIQSAMLTVSFQLTTILALKSKVTRKWSHVYWLTVHRQRRWLQRLAGASLLVFANKQDIQGALKPAEIAKVLVLLMVFLKFIVLYICLYASSPVER